MSKHVLDKMAELKARSDEFVGAWSVGVKTVDVLLVHLRVDKWLFEDSVRAVEVYFAGMDAMVEEMEKKLPEFEELPFWRRAAKFWREVLEVVAESRKYRCLRCWRLNSVTNHCGCDPDNMPTKPFEMPMKVGQVVKVEAHGKVGYVQRLNLSTWHFRLEHVKERSRFGRCVEVRSDVERFFETGALVGGDKGRW